MNEPLTKQARLMQMGWACLLDEAELPPGVAFLPLPERDTLDDEERAALDHIIDRDKRKFDNITEVRKSGYAFRVNGLWTSLLQSPRLAVLWADFGDWAMTAESRGSYSNRERQMVDMAFGTGSVHMQAAVAAGISPQDIKAVRERRLDDLDPADRQLVEYIDATRACTLTREMFESLADRMGVKTAVEYTGYITYRCGSIPSVAAANAMQGLPRNSSRADEWLEAMIKGEIEPEPYLNDDVFKHDSPKVDHSR